MSGNPLAGLGPDALTVFEDVSAMAEALVRGDGAFEDSARDLPTALFLRQLSKDERASIQSTAARQTEFLLQVQKVSDEEH
jgi:hypothetical protein